MSTTSSLAIVGMGPRGISILERLAAQLGDRGTRGVVHVIDDALHGAGRVWDTGQTRTLCMNTLAAAVTLFTEPNSSVGAPVLEGPTLYEWIRLVRDERADIKDAKTELFDAHPPQPAAVADFAEEIAQTVPHSNPSRALYGVYLRWVYSVVLARLPRSVQVIPHNARAVAVDECDNFDRIVLDDHTSINADATVLAPGWQTPAPNDEEERIAAAGLPWIRPANPLEQPLHTLPAGQPVLVRGLGMGFFDVMALLTLDRGGTFTETADGLRYEPSGREPHLLVTSGRGYPYLPKSDFGGLPPSARRPRLKAVQAELADASSINFDTQVWPAVVRDAYDAYYRVLADVRPTSLRLTYDDIVSLIDSTAPELIEKVLAPHTTEPFHLQSWVRPLAGVHGTVEEVTETIAEFMRRDIDEALQGRRSPLKAGLWSLSSSRKPAQILGAEGRYTRPSRANRFAVMMALGQMAGSGPPLFRSRELLALVEAGLVRFLGARPRLWIEDGRYAVTSPTTNEVPVRAHYLVDAWMHSPDIRRPADPLMVSLSERTRPFGPTHSPEVDSASMRLVRPDGRVDERLYLVGIPTAGQRADTTISPMPGTDALMLQETDRIARDVLARLLIDVR